MEKKDIVNKLTNVLNSNEEIDLTLSYSKISDFDRNGAIALIRPSNVDNAGLKLGSLVDDLLFNDKKYFDENYYIFDGEKPTASLGVLCDVILKNYLTLPNNIDDILDIIKTNKLWSNIKDINALVKKFDNSEFWSYLDCMYECSDRVLITNSEYNSALELVSILKEHSYSKHILDNEHENIYQLKFETKYKEFKLRGIIDITTIDHKNKIVYLTDLKTGKNTAMEFQESFIKWRYYIQGAVYKLAFNEICKHFKLKGYTLAPFQFLYISKSDKTPLLYKMTEKWMDAANNGFSIHGYQYRGLNTLIDNIYWCWKNKEYNIPKYIVENNGVVELNDNFLTVVNDGDI